MRLAPLAAGLLSFVTPNEKVRPPDPCADTVVFAVRLLAEQPHLSQAETNAAVVRLQRDPQCLPAIDAHLRNENACSHGTNVVSFALFSSPAYTGGADLARTKTGTDACLHAIVPNLQAAATIDDTLVDATLALTKSDDEDRRNAAWLVLGTFAHREPKVAPRIDALLERRLDTLDVTAIEAAGNAGCRACVSRLALGTQSSDDEVRRVAFGALRFVPDGARRACAGLRDASAAVREHAAWALGWRTDDAPVRIACLGRAATSDDASEVRDAALRALEAMPHETTLPEETTE